VVVAWIWLSTNPPSTYTRPPSAVPLASYLASGDGVRVAHVASVVVGGSEGVQPPSRARTSSAAAMTGRVRPVPMEGPD
jgi:hypothetical protein